MSWLDYFGVEKESELRVSYF